jgi:hypothetical protein
MTWSPVPLSVRKKNLMLVSCVLMTLAAVLFLAVGLTKGLGASDGVGAAALLVAGASIWLYRQTPVRDD